MLPATENRSLKGGTKGKIPYSAWFGCWAYSFMRWLAFRLDRIIGVVVGIGLGHLNEEAPVETIEFWVVGEGDVCGVGFEDGVKLVLEGFDVF